MGQRLDWILEPQIAARDQVEFPGTDSGAFGGNVDAIHEPAIFIRTALEHFRCQHVAGDVPCHADDVADLALLIAHDARVVLHMMDFAVDALHAEHVIVEIQFIGNRFARRPQQNLAVFRQNDGRETAKIVLQRHMIQAEAGQGAVHARKSSRI